MTLSKKSKGILSVIGGVFFHIGAGIINPLGNYNVYLISYINNFNKQNPFQLYYGYVIKTFISFFLLCFSPIGGMIDRKIGCHLTIMVSAMIQLASIGMLFKVTTLSGLYFAIVLLSIGMGIGVKSPVKNACFFMPEHKGLINSVIVAMGALSSPLFNLVGEAIINPDNKILEPHEQYYDYSLMKNLYSYYYICIIGVIMATFFSACFIFQYRAEDYQSQAQSQLAQPLPLHGSPQYNTIEQGQAQAPIQSQSQSQTNQSQRQPSRRNQSHYYNDMMQILFSYRVWNIFLISFFGNFLPFIVSISFKAIGTYARFSVEMLKYTTSLMGIVKNGISPLWGYLFDRLGYGPLIKILNICTIIQGILMCFSIHNEISFSILCILNTVFIAGFRSVLEPFVMKIYSIDYMMELQGVIGLSLGMTSMIGSVIALTTSNHFENKTFAYCLIFLLGSSLSFVSFLLSLLEKETAYVFNRKEENKEKNQEKLNEFDDDKVSLLKK